jgi:putative toxin-antitoxin system antitoxin component (TIGR02293 family)
MPGTLLKNRNAAKVLSRYEPFFQNNISLLSKAKKGLQPEAVFDFILISDLSNEQVETALNRSMKTFQNYKEKKTLLDTSTSEKLLKLFALYNEGAEIFGSLDAFTDWLSRPAYGIGKQVPRDLLDTMTGIDLITDELKRIEYGDLA